MNGVATSVSVIDRLRASAALLRTTRPQDFVALDGEDAAFRPSHKAASGPEKRFDPSKVRPAVLDILTLASADELVLTCGSSLSDLVSLLAHPDPRTRVGYVGALWPEDYLDWPDEDGVGYQQVRALTGFGALSGPGAEGLPGGNEGCAADVEASLRYGELVHGRDLKFPLPDGGRGGGDGVQGPYRGLEPPGRSPAGASGLQVPVGGRSLDDIPRVWAAHSPRQWVFAREVAWSDALENTLSCPRWGGLVTGSGELLEEPTEQRQRGRREVEDEGGGDDR